MLSFSYRWWLERKRALEQLKDLNNLLRLTIYDASGTLNTIKGLLDLMQEDPDVVPVERLSKHVSIVADLLDQIKLVRRYSQPTESWRRERVSLLNLILEVSDFVGDRLKNKNLLLRYDPEKLSSAQLHLNKGLFGHSVLGNLIAHVIRTSAPGSVVSIDYDRQQTSHEIRIVSQTLNPEQISKPRDEMGVQIATEVLRLHHGSLSINTDAAGKTTTTVTLIDGQLH
ncbi:MAG: sensor histidine kinase [Bacteriovoracia bacterium]